MIPPPLSQRWLHGLLAASLLVAAPAVAQASWDHVKEAMARGDYRAASQALDVILSAAPADARALAYRQICQKRLSVAAEFRPADPAALDSLAESLKREQEAQKRHAVVMKTLERRIEREQAAWDKDLQQQVKREAQQRRREAAQQRRRAAAPSRPEPARPAAQPPLAVSAPAPPSIEVAPAALPPAPTPAPPVVYPSPEEIPPGAIRIFGDQLSASPDRKLAVARGHVHIIFSEGVVTCDQATLFTDTQDVYAQGRVRVESGADVFRGELVHYNLKTKKGRFLEGTAYQEPWYEHGRVVEHVAEGVLRLRPGYLTSCELEPPHFRFQGRQATVFSDDKIARSRNVALLVEELPFFYLPWLSLADRQTPFFLIPGKKKPWEQFALMGYRYEWPAGQKGALRMDWRRAFGWGFGVDHQFDDPRFGKGLIKLYYNEEPDMRATNPKKDTLPKGAALKRYRMLLRHNWEPLPGTNVVTSIQEFSDENFRRDFLFREEYVGDDTPESYISWVTNDEHYLLDVLVRKRMNRFDTVTEAFPDAKFQIVSRPIGDSYLYTNSQLGFANLQTKNAHSDSDTDVVRLDWLQQFRYALNWFRPAEVTPNVGVRQTYYTKDIQSGSTDRPEGKRDILAGQFSGGADLSLKLFRIFPIVTNRWGLNLNLLRHVVTPTVSYSYVHQPTVPNSVLAFPSASGAANQVTFGLENKLQTKRSLAEGEKPRGVDLARALLSIPYTFRGNGNKQGGRLGDWAFDIELYPWPWLRLETNWSYPSHFVKGIRDERVTGWNVDLVMVGGKQGAGAITAQQASDIQAPERRTFEPGQQFTQGVPLLPQGQWYLGFGHRYSYNDKTEDVLQFDWRLTEKWQIGTFHRLTWKEAISGSKRFNNVREYQYTLTRDLHDWIAELAYRVDREYGEELWFTMTLKAYPDLPIEIGESYHQPKIGSQSSPFSPVRGAK
ncbi:MAG: LPS-assembly protein LptD [Candidatus Omnitrophica bacterium]|nr:LPS-assembly protein LptD [Candidatus Omnitrophota bacterium]